MSGSLKAKGILSVPDEANDVIKIRMEKDCHYERSGRIISVNGKGVFVIVNWKERRDGRRIFEVAEKGDVWKDKGGRLHVREGGLVYVLYDYQFIRLLEEGSPIGKGDLRNSKKSGRPGSRPGGFRPIRDLGVSRRSS